MRMKTRLLEFGSLRLGLGLGAVVLGFGVAAWRLDLLTWQETILPAPSADVAEFEDRLAMPDLTQTEYANCAPTAVSNSLMWLAERGYPALLGIDPPLPASGAAVPGGHAPDPDRDPAALHVHLARTLAGERYLATHPKEGTPLPSLLAGLEAFLGDRGIEPELLTYRGWRIMPERHKSGPHPDLEWIEEGLTGARAVWIQVGFYEHDAAAGDYHRLWGHTITLVAKGRDDTGKVGWVAHDPAPYCGTDKRHELIFAAPLEGGELKGDYVGLPQPAAGFYRLAGWPIPDRADVAILDGATRMDL